MLTHYINAWKKGFDFSGRARRMEYWTFTLFNVLIIYGMGILGGIIGLDSIIYPASMIFYFATIIPSLAAIIRRMHDVGESGWFCLIPIYNIILCFTDSQSGPNKYGPNPKESRMNIDDHLVA